MVGCDVPTSSSLARVTFLGDGAGRVNSPLTACQASCDLSGPLDAVAGPHSRFEGWSGPCEGTGRCDPKGEPVGARFVATEYPLELRTSGEGSILADSAAKELGTHWLPVDSKLILVAVPAPGWMFVRWQAFCVARPAPDVCELLINHAQPAVAVFEQGAEVTAAVDGPGTVVGLPPIGQCTSRCSALVPRGATVTLSAVASPGNSFSGWSSGCGTSSTCRLTANQSTTVTARFHPNVNVVAGGDGSGLVAGVANCSSLPCSLEWLPGRTLRLEASPHPHSRFIRFIGCPSVSGRTCTISQYTPQVQVVFDRITTSVTVGEAAEVRGGFLVTAPESEFVWMEAVGPMTFGGVGEQDAGVIDTVDSRWVLFQTRPPPIREVLNLGNRATVRFADRQLDGGMVFVARANVPIALGQHTLAADEEAFALVNASGALEWVVPNRGPGSDILNLKTNRATGQSYYMGALREDAAPISVSATTILPSTDGGLSRIYVGSLDRYGNLEWMSPRFEAPGRWDAWPLLALNQGPVVLDEAPGLPSVGSCLPSRGQGPPPWYASSFFTRDGACRFGAFGGPVRTANLRFAGATDEASTGITLVGKSNGPASWGSRGGFYFGSFFAPVSGPDYHVRLYHPDKCPSFNEPRFVAPVGSSLLVGGDGACSPATAEVYSAWGAWVGLYNNIGQPLSTSPVFHFAQFVGAGAPNDGEIRLLVRPVGPATVLGVTYPAWRHLLLLSLRP